ncbi:MAG TPA: dipeptide epimerase, partial [Myxococcota bacterium]|nr:dipeptide epimerase [Myxococcota bacterium]
LRYPFGLSRGTTLVRQSLVVELTEDGQSGFGEATDNTYYGVTCEALVARLEAVRPSLEAHPFDTPEDLWATLQPQLGDAPFALSAVDNAAYDLWGKRLGKPVYALWGLSADSPRPPTSYTIALDRPDVMVHKVREREPWPLYKVKLGGAADLEVVRALREVTTSPLRVDPNGGWSPVEATRLVPPLATLGVELVEQPLPAEAWDAMRRLRADTPPLPFIADESCQGEADVARCQGAFHGINIKVMKCGGLTVARRMIVDARSRGLKVMVGCMVESTVGISAAAQLLPLIDYADMDGPLLLAQDIARGVRIEAGHLFYADTPGCGVELL